MRFEIDLPFQPPLAWGSTLEFLSLRAISGLERATPARYERTIALGRGRGWIEAEIARVCPGLRVPGCWDGFELAVRAVLGQQARSRARGPRAAAARSAG